MSVPNWEEIDLRKLVMDCIQPSQEELRRRHRDYLRAIEPLTAHVVYLYCVFPPRYLLNTETKEITTIPPDFPPWAEESITMTKKMIREMASSFGLDVRSWDHKEGE
ncbi:hypothetical protein EJP67_18550 [Variovorax guangxiensis]|uniref:Uncharacterized protein n=1 Tax=Variovorax guangxiensis TaxID=1775474 RepID=A0A3S0XGV5_9BURK|nr:hypothetical protein [Variovorax guangxiensis]RUR69062.1 hypothetical protein EJP67_18550 [Variovorax guangxiensis]